MSGTGGTAGAGGTVADLRHGPFKIIVLSSVLDFRHDSILTCFKLLQDLGKATAPERAKITGLAPDSTWTVDQIADDPTKPNYFSEVSAENLKNYELFYSNNPTGTVFTSAPNGAQKKQAFVDYWNNGGSWAGQHSATDFEKHGSWAWFQDNINGAYFVDHDPHTATGTVTWESGYINHPILKGLASPWSTSDEWYVMHRNVEAVPGFKVIAKVTVSNSSLGTSATAGRLDQGEHEQQRRPVVLHNPRARPEGLRRAAVPRPDAARDPLVGSPIARWRLDRFRKRELLAC